MAKACCLLVLLALPLLLDAQTTDSKATAKNPREFVEGFYKWYVPNALSDNVTRAWDLALQYKSSAFSPQLALRLEEDSDAQARCDELIGIDFDPFLFTQDPEERYEVGEISHKGEVYRADIYGVRSGKRFDTPAVSAVFSEKNGRWLFLDFYYPSDGTDLLTILRSPRPACTVPRPAAKRLDAPGGPL
jgi:hypothetical protein